MRAVVDCNSFYCSCEKVFRPDLWKRPVVVLSNNDGCIISRSDEAKKIGIGMAGPYFLAKPLIEKHHVETFSSNYHLYGDMSRRVMDTLRNIIGEDRVEVYSVDEAFLDLSHIPADQLKELADALRDTVYQWTGIEVSVGIATTKTLCKVANHLAKKNKAETNCVYILDTPDKIYEALQKTEVNDIWGVGRKYAVKLMDNGIATAWDLSRIPEEWASRHLGGVIGARLIRELNGKESIKTDKPLVNKKMIATTRMFGDAVSNLRDIKEAIATYTSRAAEKLRRQQGAANVISIFVVPKEKANGPRFSHGPMLSSSVVLSKATADTKELIKPALLMAEKLFEDGRLYKKAGVILSGIVPDESIQGNLFTARRNESRLLMDTIDNVNFSMRDDVVKFAAAGTAKNWKMRQELRSPRYTTRWDEIFNVS
ncbi:MAG: Y-family polymerase [Chitinophagaceae bacterium]|nr:Y-family polymerase [Chitinophagaceae bacterium]